MELKEKWKQFADELGFQFHEGIEALIQSPQLLERVAGEELPKGKQDFNKMKSMLDHPFVKSMLSKVFLGMAAGNYEGFEFFIYRSSTTSSNNVSSYYVNTVLFYKRDLKLGMEIQPASFFSRLGRKLFSKSHILTGNPQLDHMTIINGDDQEATRSLLQAPGLQPFLVELFALCPDIKVTDNGIRVKESGETITKEHALELMTPMVKAAKIILEAHSN